MFRVVYLTLLVLATQSLGKDCDKKFHGFKIDFSQRECLEGEAVDCKSPFPYNTIEECRLDFSGHGNICDKSQPCRNKGVCLPTMHLDSNQKRQRDFKCDCHGTGYFGRHCEMKCTKDLPRHNRLAEACLF